MIKCSYIIVERIVSVLKKLLSIVLGTTTALCGSGMVNLSHATNSDESVLISEEKKYSDKVAEKDNDVVKKTGEKLDIPSGNEELTEEDKTEAESEEKSDEEDKAEAESEEESEEEDKTETESEEESEEEDKTEAESEEESEEEDKTEAESEEESEEEDKTEAESEEKSDEEDKAEAESEEESEKEDKAEAESEKESGKDKAKAEDEEESDEDYDDEYETEESVTDHPSNPILNIDPKGVKNVFAHPFLIVLNTWGWSIVGNIISLIPGVHYPAIIRLGAAIFGLVTSVFSLYVDGCGK